MPEGQNIKPELHMTDKKRHIVEQQEKDIKGDTISENIKN